MTKTLKCIGWVFAGIGIVAGFGVALLAVTAALIWAGMATAVALGYEKEAGFLFMLGYLFLGGGIFVGVMLCTENR